MKTKLITMLAIATALVVGQPAFAKDKSKGGAHPAQHVAAAHHAAPHIARAGGSRPAFHAAPRSFAAVNGRSRAVATAHVNNNVKSFKGVAVNNRASAGRNLATANTSKHPALHPFLANNRGTVGSTPSGTFNRFGARTGGRNSANLAGRGGNNGGGGFSGGNSQYAFASRNGWSRDRDYDSDGHHYHWYDNGWFVVDPGFYYGSYYYPGPGANYYGGYSSSVAIQVQQALANDGYYQGPEDGIIGPISSGAIAAYQRDYGLRVTGTITNELLQSLQIG